MVARVSRGATGVYMFDVSSCGDVTLRQLLICLDGPFVAISLYLFVHASKLLCSALARTSA